MRKFELAIIAGGLFLALQAHASIDISALDTGAGLYGGPAGTIDHNWTVSLLAHVSPNPAPVSGAAYLVPNIEPNQPGYPNFPFPPWVANTPTSSWVSYSSPLQVGGDFSSSVYQYQMSFRAVGSGTIGVRFLSDNASQFFVNGGLIGTRPNAFNATTLDESTFRVWNSFINFNVLAGQVYTVDLDVFNTPFPPYNPTGGRVEFNGGVQVTPVPEASTIIAGALLLLPFGAGVLRTIRKDKAA